MIRINLLKNIGTHQIGSETKITDGLSYGEVKKVSYANLLMKVGVVILLPYSLTIYQDSILSTKNKTLNQLKAQQTEYSDQVYG